MPFGLGFHTAFNLPDDGKVTVTAGEGYWEMGQPRHLPSGRLLPWRDSGSVFNGHQAVSCHCPVTTEMIDGKPFRGAIIEYQAERTQLRYEIDEQYRHWCLWNDSGGKGFFCIEPMTWMVNAPNLDLPPKITGMQTINPGKTLELQTRISLIRCF
jgi:aldose 1-epimerase